jgi:hypothetical protein
MEKQGVSPPAAHRELADVIVATSVVDSAAGDRAVKNDVADVAFDRDKFRSTLATSLRTCRHFETGGAAATHVRNGIRSCTGTFARDRYSVRANTRTMCEQTG